MQMAYQRRQNIVLTRSCFFLLSPASSRPPVGVIIALERCRRSREQKVARAKHLELLSANAWCFLVARWHSICHLLGLLVRAVRPIGL